MMGNIIALEIFNKVRTHSLTILTKFENEDGGSSWDKVSLIKDDNDIVFYKFADFGGLHLLAEAELSDFEFYNKVEF